MIHRRIPRFFKEEALKQSCCISPSEVQQIQTIFYSNKILSSYSPKVIFNTISTFIHSSASKFGGFDLMMPQFFLSMSII